MVRKVYQNSIDSVALHYYRIDIPYPVWQKATSYTSIQGKLCGCSTAPHSIKEIRDAPRCQCITVNINDWQEKQMYQYGLPSLCGLLYRCFSKEKLKHTCKWIRSNWWMKLALLCFYFKIDVHLLSFSSVPSLFNPGFNVQMKPSTISLLDEHGMVA